MTSLIITAYNYGQYLERCIRSALNQTKPEGGFEVLVIDDASRDRTPQILDNFSDDIRYVRLEENKGLSHARNLGVKMAKGQFVVFLDADDYVHKDFLYLERTIMGLNPLLDAVSCDYYLVDERGRHMEYKKGDVDPIACGIMFRKDLLFEIGLYDEDFFAREEEDLRKRWLMNYEIFNIPAALYRYRMHQSNLTKDELKMENGKKKLIDKHGKQ